MLIKKYAYENYTSRILQLYSENFILEILIDNKMCRAAID